MVRRKNIVQRVSLASRSNYGNPTTAKVDRKSLTSSSMPTSTHAPNVVTGQRGKSVKRLRTVSWLPPALRHLPPTLTIAPHSTGQRRVQRKKAVRITPPAPTASPVPTTQLTPAQKRFRYKGTAALNSTNRVYVDNDDKKDISYEPPTEIVAELATLPKMSFEIRSYTRTFYNIASNLEVLADDHGAEDEHRQYATFYHQVAMELGPPSGPLFESPHVVWYPKILRYSDRSKRLASIPMDSTSFLSESNAALSTVAKDVRRLILRCPKPVLVLVGQAMVRNEGGHVQVVAIQQTERGRRAVVKDSLPKQEAVIKTLTYKLLQALSVKKVDLVHELVEEEDVTYTECLKEAYKIVGDALDNRAFWDRKITGFYRTYNVSRKVEMLPTPSNLSFFN
ncbi:unnamed protein product [Orchesella dallaii]|uniref:Uncharacterized protein n=1 Tax=Orchesella dallaii TaxID=48710 RepID=A0ABP1QMG4_9HEXA